VSNAARRRGRTRELAYLHHLLDQGWVAFRIDGSGDLVAGKSGKGTYLLQVKSTLTPYAHFLPADRQRLSEDAASAGWWAALIWWPKGIGLDQAKWISEADWPGSQALAA
jgi:hypothetical protein